MTVTCHFDFDLGEHYRADRSIRRRTPFYGLPPVFGTLSFIAFVWSFLQPRNEEVTAFGQAWVTWLLMTIFTALLPIIRKRSLRKIAETEPSLKGTQERRLDASGYHSKGNDIALDLPWHGIRRCLETKEFFLFFYFKNWAYYLPKRALSADQLLAARAIIREGLGSRADLLA